MALRRNAETGREMTDQIRCFGCGYNKPESEVTCLRCLTTCKIELANLPILLRQAGGFLQPGSGGRGSSSGERTIGVNVSALDFVAGHDLLGTLYAWQDLTRDLLGLHERLTLRGDVQSLVERAVEFLQVHWEWFSKQDDFIGDFIREIRGLHSRGMAITGQNQPKVRQIGCPTDTGTGLCGRKLTVDGSDLNAVIECKRCKTNWTTSWLIQVALDQPHADVWVDAEAIAQYKNLSPNHVRKVAKKWSVPQIGSLYHLPKFLAEYEKQKRAAK